MNRLLPPNSGVSATSLSIELADIPAEQVLLGSPKAGSLPLGNLGEIEIGIWEHTVGKSFDVEIEEFFIVLSGSATIEFVDPKFPTLQVGPGDVVRLAAGTETNWTVHETLRKVYIA
jgi:uncharacterized cupin superfamily protein